MTSGNIAVMLPFNMAIDFKVIDKDECGGYA